MQIEKVGIGQATPLINHSHHLDEIFDENEDEKDQFPGLFVLFSHKEALVRLDAEQSFGGKRSELVVHQVLGHVCLLSFWNLRF